MTHVDDAIRRALSPEDLATYDALGRDLSPVQEALAAFRSQHRLFAIGGWVAGFALFLAGAYCIWRFFGAADMRGMLTWAGGAGFAMMSLGMVKLWFWMEMQKNGVIRELKRLELQVASLIALVQRP